MVALDAQREWYRCHHLLRDALLRDPAAGSDADRRDVLRRAASWFADHGQLDDAVRCLLGAEDSVEAAAMLASAERWFLERGAAAGLLRLGEELPSEVVGASARPRPRLRGIHLPV